MKRENRYSLRDLKKQFPNDRACLEYIFDALHSRECSCGGRYAILKGRRQYQCSKCRHQIAPTAGTIFHKSDTPLNLWFWAIFIFSSAKSGVSAKELERQLGVTYKTAWRILMFIRKALPQEMDLLQGIVEMDEAYFGGKKGYKDARHRPSFTGNKAVVMGAAERQGRIRAKLAPDATAQSITRFIDRNIHPMDTKLYTDKSNRYGKAAWGYDREAVNHSKKEWKRGQAHINTVEAFWAHVKRSVSGTHKVVSKKYLQAYLDGFVFHYNNRRSDRERFSSLLGALLQPSK